MTATAATATTAATARTAAHAPTQHRPAGGHGEPLRGLMYTPISPFTQGRFGRMFRMLPAAEYGNSDTASLSNLKLLATEMSLKPAVASTGAPSPTAGTASPTAETASPTTETASPATDSLDPNDQPDARESGIPALYTYFGQFVDHDITYDPSSLMQKRNDPDSMVDYRTPAFDLDSLYGRGPSDDPYMYDIPDDPSAAASFLLGSPLFQQSDSDTAQTAQRPPDGWDLPRNRVNELQKRALIGDPRNDEHAIVSQLHGLFLRFHNRIAQAKDKPSFGIAQQRVRFHYEYLILHDFLPRIVNSSILEALKTDDLYDRGKLKFYRWKDIPYMPIEFSVAAYRMGHSMIRDSYRLNDGNVRPVFSSTGPNADNPNPDLRGFQPLPGTWALDWGRFINIDIRAYSGSAVDNKRRLQFAFKMGTSLVDPLADLPDMGAVGGPKSLAQRNLERGWRLRLPSGQSVAHAMGIPEDQVLKDEEIAIGPNKKLITQVSSAFRSNCPLWTYILAEAMKHAEEVEIPVQDTQTIMTPKLGPVGGRIVAEVFLGLMFGDPNSMLNLYPNWQPNPGSTESYTLKDFVLYALGK